VKPHILPYCEQLSYVKHYLHITFCKVYNAVLHPKEHIQQLQYIHYSCATINSPCHH